MTFARGWSEPLSADAPSETTCSSVKPSAARVLTIRKRPDVKVPVLSNTTVSTAAPDCRIEPPRTRMPRRANPPMPATIAAGVARISAHGQPTINTATMRSQSAVK